MEWRRGGVGGESNVEERGKYGGRKRVGKAGAKVGDWGKKAKSERREVNEHGRVKGYDGGRVGRGGGGGGKRGKR